MKICNLKLQMITWFPTNIKHFEGVNNMEKLANLFEEWRLSRDEYQNNFAPDGIINEIEWEATNPKIMLMLKETNDYNDDVCKLVREVWEGTKYPIWNNIARWTYGISNIRDGYYPAFVEANRPENMKKSVMKIAIMNLKKTTGGGSSDMEIIQEYALRDKSFISRELELIKPKVVICGSTFDIVKKIFGSENFHEVEGSDGYLFRFGEIVFINYWHPASRFPAKLLYHTICSTFCRMQK